MPVSALAHQIGVGLCPMRMASRRPYACAAASLRERMSQGGASAGSLFGNVPRPAGGSASGGNAGEVASHGLAQVSSFFSSVSDNAAQALHRVSENQHMQTLQGAASKLAADASSSVRATPLGTVGAFAAQQAEQTKNLITGESKEPEGLQDYVEEAMTLSYKKRLVGFAITLATGIFFTSLSTLLLPLIVLKPHKFAVAYSLGNLLMMLSTVFLVGPKKQCQSMWTGHRAAVFRVCLFICLSVYPPESGRACVAARDRESLHRCTQEMCACMSWNSNDGIECAQASGAYFGSMIGTIYAAMVLRIYLLVSDGACVQCWRTCRRVFVRMCACSCLCASVISLTCNVSR